MCPYQTVDVGYRQDPKDRVSFIFHRGLNDRCIKPQKVLRCPYTYGINLTSKTESPKLLPGLQEVKIVQESVTTATTRCLVGNSSVLYKQIDTYV